MSLEVEAVQGIVATVKWQCEECGHRKRLKINVGEAKEVECERCGNIDNVVMSKNGGKAE